jgi:ubiquinol-cytochrome c reductase cytochrome b subunit
MLWLEQRTGLSPVIAALLHVRVPRAVQTFYFGGIALMLFGVQVVTGTLLSLYYTPATDHAYDSVLFITSDVDFGWLIRSIHHWGANLMVVFVVLHMLRVFFQAAYKYPRELTWIVGVGLFGLTILFGFTGYLLPWDQRAYWATTVGTEIAGGVPVIGDFLLNVLRGGADVSQATLSRFFGFHVLVLPLLTGGALVLHLVFVHQLGLAHPRKRKLRPPQSEMDGSEPLLPFWPNYLLDELIAWYVLLAAMVVLASLFPAGLEPTADPLLTPEHIKPEWYFLGVYELLKLVPRVVGILAPVGVIGLITVLPFLDRSPEVLLRRRKFIFLVATALLAGTVVLTYMGFNS